MSVLKDKIKLMAEPALSRKFENFILDSTDDGLFHMDAARLADIWGISRNEAIGVFLKALHEGIFVSDWHYHCPQCGGIVRESKSLHEAHEEDFCEPCQLNFQNRLDGNMGVYFNVHPDIRPLPEQFKKDFRDNMEKELEQNRSYRWKKPEALLGIEVLNHTLFRELFGNETLMPDQTLAISKTTVMLTDIRQSTELYARIGDARAYRLVREHFIIVFDIIQSHEGVAVKTVGDKVMGVFNNETNALKAALEIQKMLGNYYKTKPAGEQIVLKIGLNSGPAVAVTLNGRLDYFGTTVNNAARIQSLAGPNEVILPEAVFENTENRNMISRYVKKVYKRKALLGGSGGEMILYSVRF